MRLSLRRAGRSPSTRNSEAAVAKMQRCRGLIAVLILGALLAATGVAYVHPTGKNTYTAHLGNAGGLRSGDDVRIAGISVGKVTHVRVDHSWVEAQLLVDRSVSLGIDTTLDVKLLTPLGGHYASLDPRGETPLGANAIPPEHTTVPFEINQIFQTFTPIVKQVDGQVIRQTFTAIAKAAHGYPDALRDTFASTRELVHSLSATTADYRKAMTLVGEYSRTFADGGAELTSLIDQFATIGTKYTTNSVNIVELFYQLSELGRLVHRLATAYSRDYAPLFDGIDDIFETLFADPRRLGEAAEYFGQIANIVGPMLSGNGVTVSDGNHVIPGQDVCLPHYFRRC